MGEKPLDKEVPFFNVSGFDKRKNIILRDMCAKLEERACNGKLCRDW